eukprot:jgi/Mesen1/10305/ME000079S09725
MKVGKGSAVLITGAGSGIGRAVALQLAKQGASVTVVDFSEKEGRRTLELLEQQSSSASSPPGAIFVKCDVSRPDELAGAFRQHMRAFGRLDVCMNNAGIGEREWFVQDVSEDGAGEWRKVIDINLVAVIDGTRLA